MTRLLLVPAAFVLIAAAPAGDDGQTNRTRPDTDGTWKLLAAEVDGEPLVGKDLAAWTITIVGQRGKVEFHRDGIVEVYQFGFQLLPGSQVNFDGVARGAYRWQREVLEIRLGCFAATERSRLLLYRNR